MHQKVKSKNMAAWSYMQKKRIYIHIKKFWVPKKVISDRYLCDQPHGSLYFGRGALGAVSTQFYSLSIFYAPSNFLPYNNRRFLVPINSQSILQLVSPWSKLVLARFRSRCQYAMKEGQVIPSPSIPAQEQTCRHQKKFMSQCHVYRKVNKSGSSESRLRFEQGGD